jgi:hypothetical protein
MKAPCEFDPIFVHASPRSGSTYFFNVLRRIDSLLCFNEAIIDGKRDYARFKKVKERGLLHREARKWNVNHHFLDRDDFEEFLEAWDEVMHLCPEFPTFYDYLPANGILSAELAVYLSALMKYARSRGKRPVLCEINSRGRAGALRGAFGGFHIAQYRDPLSQFGSFIRAVTDAGFWGFLAFPVTELGTSGTHPLYRLVPEAWRAPPLPWLAETRAQHWASDAQYFATVGSSRPENVEKVFRWHLFSWFLTNLAALSYSDFAIDIDKIHDNADYRASVTDIFEQRIGGALDLSDVRKFDRYYEFESFDVAAVCNQVFSTVSGALSDGRLDDAIRTLGIQPPVTPTATAVELLLVKICDSLTSMAASADRQNISSEEWKAIAEKNRKIWFNPGIRRLAQHVYPLAAPVVRAARRAGIWV